jgi:hypothetical protein
MRRLGGRLVAALAVLAGVSACGQSSGSSDTSTVKTLLCTGSTGGSCAGFAEGTVCPEDSRICIECAAGAYADSEGVCRCTSGTWQCGPPEAGSVTCDNPTASTGYYADPGCSVPYGTDAGLQGSLDSGGDASEGDAADGDYACAVDAPEDGSACPAEGQECGYLLPYVTMCNGSSDCYCQGGAWTCGPTCGAGPEEAGTYKVNEAGTTDALASD